MIFQLHEHARIRDFGDGGVLILQDAGDVLTLNEVGAFVAVLLKEPMHLDRVTAAVTREFDVPLETAVQDIPQYIDALREAGALVESGEPGPR